ncbi:MAG: hypothetical protein LBQ32_04455 [Burkholderiaceae bacterium]|nr:hypothetical protein [Burkholderiaceae bacterium]
MNITKQSLGEMPIPYLKPHEVAIPQLQKRLALTDVMACLNAPALGHAIECQRFLIFTKQLLGEMSIPPRGKGKKDGSLHQVKPVDLLAGTLEALPLHHAPRLRHRPLGRQRCTLASAATASDTPIRAKVCVPNAALAQRRQGLARQSMTRLFKSNS